MYMRNYHSVFLKHFFLHKLFTVSWPVTRITFFLDLFLTMFRFILWRHNTKTTSSVMSGVSVAVLFRFTNEVEVIIVYFVFNGIKGVQMLLNITVPFGTVLAGRVLLCLLQQSVSLHDRFLLCVFLLMIVVLLVGTGKLLLFKLCSQWYEEHDKGTNQEESTTNIERCHV